MILGMNADRIVRLVRNVFNMRLCLWRGAVMQSCDPIGNVNAYSSHNVEN